MIKRAQTCYELLKKDMSLDSAYYFASAKHLVEDEPGIALRSVASHRIAMEMFEEKVFIVDPDLAKAFEFTDVSSVPLEYFRPPFPMQYIECPFKIESNDNDYRGFFIAERDREESYTVIDISVMGFFKSGAYPERPVPLAHIPIRMGCTGDILKHIDERATNNHENLKKYTKIIFNVLAFINSKKDNVNESWTDIDGRLKKLHGKRLEKAKAAIKRDYTLSVRVGGKIVLDGKLRKALRESAETGRSVSTRFIVRGHWRHQWMGSDVHGSRRQELKWIQPFWKGDPLAEVVNKPYHLVSSNVHA